MSALAHVGKKTSMKWDSQSVLHSRKPPELGTCGGGGEAVNSSCLLILRDIVDLHNYLSDPMTPQFQQMIFVPAEGSSEAASALDSPMDSSCSRSSQGELLELRQVRSMPQEIHPMHVATDKGKSVSVPALHKILSEHDTGHLASTGQAVCPTCLKNMTIEVLIPSKAHVHFNNGPGEWIVDEEADCRLRFMKYILKTIVPEKNTLTKEVLWRYEEVISPTLHREYLRELCSETYNVMRRLVDESSQTLEEMPQLDAIAQENLMHWRHCKALTRDVCTEVYFTQRHTIRQYVTGHDNHPLIICGEVGFGKTKLISSLAMELAEQLKRTSSDEEEGGEESHRHYHHQKYIFAILRYVGLTRQTAELTHLLRSVARNVCALLGRDPALVPLDYQELKGLFKGDVPQCVPAPGVTFVVFIDSLSVLKMDRGMSLKEWLPPTLAPCFKVVVTLNPDFPDCLWQIYPKSTIVLHITEPSLPEADLLMRHFLTTYNRQLNDAQWSEVDKLFSKCTSPLYIKLLSMELRTVRSFTPHENLAYSLSSTLEDALDSFLDRLEANHKVKVVSRVLAYLAASQVGLSDLEIEDLLSLDDVLLRAVYGQTQPSVYRVPCSVWLKLRRDMEPFLLEEQAEGEVTVTVLEHPKIATAIEKRYFQPNPEEHLAPFHSMMADYFLGTWANTGKPTGNQTRRGSSQDEDLIVKEEMRKAQKNSSQELLEEPQERKAFVFGPSVTTLMKVKEEEEEEKEDSICCSPGFVANRLVPSQPHLFNHNDEDDDDDNTVHTEKECRLNKRVYSRLPHHLELSGRKGELYRLVLFNYKWIYFKILGFSLTDCIEDYLRNPSLETNLVLMALQDAAPVLEKDLNNLGPELSGRLLPYCASQPWIQTLVHSCDIHGLNHNVLLPRFPYHQVPGNPLEHTLNLGFAPQSLILLNEDSVLLAKRWDSSKVCVWDINTSSLRYTVVTSLGELYVTPSGSSFVIKDRETEKTFKIHDPKSGQLLNQAIPLKGMKPGGSRDPNYLGPVSLSDSHLLILLHLPKTTKILLHKIPSGEVHYSVSLDTAAPSTACVLLEEDKDSSFAICSSYDKLLIFDSRNMRQLHCLQLPAPKPHLMTVMASGRLIILAFMPNLLVIMQVGSDKALPARTVPTNERIADDTIKALRVAPNDKMFLACCDGLVLVYEFESLSADSMLSLELGGDSLDYHEPCEEQLRAVFDKPKNLPDEFRLPGFHPRRVVFHAAEFCARSERVLAAVLRSVCIWDIRSKRLVTIIQTPVGMTIHLFVTRPSDQLLTYNDGSNDVMVWRHRDIIQGSTYLQQDRLTRPVERVLVTADLAFVQGRNSDMIGVFDLNTGILRHLLTHVCEVLDFSITLTGDVALVVTKTQINVNSCHLWNVPERRILREWGDSGGPCLAFNKNPALILFHRSPFPPCLYNVSLIHFTTPMGDFDAMGTQADHAGVCCTVRGRPVVTYDDCYIIVSSVKRGNANNQCLVVLDIPGSMEVSEYGGEDFGLGEDMLDNILQLQPSTSDHSTIALLVSIKQDQAQSRGSVVDGFGKSEFPTELILFDLRDATVNKRIPFTFNFCPLLPLSPFSPSHPLLLISSDLGLCLDHKSKIYDITMETDLAEYLVPPHDLRPVALAQQGGCSYAMYYKGSTLYVMRVFSPSLVSRCDVHAQICNVTLCLDQHTLLIGCIDGTLASYLIIDPMKLQKSTTLSYEVLNIHSRKICNWELHKDPQVLSSRSDSQTHESGASVMPLVQRTWDQVDDTSLKVIEDEVVRKMSKGPTRSLSMDRKLLNVIPIERPRAVESILKPVPCKCLRQTTSGHWVKLKQGKVGFRPF